MESRTGNTYNANSEDGGASKVTVANVVFSASAIAGALNPAFWVVSLPLMNRLRSQLAPPTLSGSPAPVFLVLPLLALIIAMAVAAPWPTDDLLRNVVAHQVGFDYRNIYFGTTLPAWDMWIGFDWILSHLEHWFGRDSAVRITQWAAGIALFWPFIAALRAELPNSQDRWMWIGLAVMVCVATPTMGRIISARPELFFAGLVLAALTLRPWAWVVLALIMAPLYWLAPIYAAGGLLLKTRWQNKIVAVCVTGLGSIGIWWVLSDGAWLQVLQTMQLWMQNRQGEVAENTPLVILLSNPIAILLLPLAVNGLIKQPLPANTCTYFLVLAYFVAPNMVRYASIILPLSLVIAARYLNAVDVQISSRYRYLSIIFMAALLMYGIPGVSSKRASTPQFEVPAGARVLTGFDSASYSMVYANPKAHFAPSFELGANSIPIQKLALSMRKGDFDCAVAHREGISHVVEAYLNSPPGCLELTSTQGAWRLWKLR